MSEPQRIRIEVADENLVCDDCDAKLAGMESHVHDGRVFRGMIFGSRAICPTCHPRWMREIERHREEHMIRAENDGRQSFHEFVILYNRGELERRRSECRADENA